jgi:S1-C subfamily serine protease
MYSTIIAVGVPIASADESVNIPVSAPVDTDTAGKSGDIATRSVVRIICVENGSGGTGFLHRSGNIITAGHVVRIMNNDGSLAGECKKPEMITPTGIRAPVAILASDPDHDLALLKPGEPISGKPLTIADNDDIKVGTQVSTWGFPAGYNGLSPILSVGYLSGIDAVRMNSGTIVKQWVVNAAFNGGNSGGPVIHIETGSVIGVVSSKLAPISPFAAMALTTLTKHHYRGVQYDYTMPDGTKSQLTEGQIIGRVLTELRRQVQLVIGKAVTRSDLVAFLKAHNIEP